MNIVDLLANQGVAIVIAIYLMWWVTTKLSSKLDSIEYKLEQILLELRKLNSHSK
jgi:hypothetical protein